MKPKYILLSLALSLLTIFIPLSCSVFADGDDNNGAASSSCTDPISCISQGSGGASGGGQSEKTISETIGDVINTILFIAGILSVIMIIYGGIRYTTSAGDSSKITTAKNTLMYAIVGLVVSILAYAIVNTVIGIFKKDDSGGDGDEAHTPTLIIADYLV